jgi:branched-chain amino acid transport system ATP-binding protein
MLKVNDIHVYYEAIHALKGVTFSVAKGELVTLLGANGAGKTTTLKTLSGLLRPRRGEVELEGNGLKAVRPHEIVRRGVAHVPEGRKIFPRFTVRENLEIGAFTRPKGTLGAAIDYVFSMFPRLKERHKQYAGTLSGGEQQMLAIGRALMTHPELLILDEATEGLAPLIAREIWRILRALREGGLATIIVDKNFAALSALADHNLILVKGLIVFEGSADELRAKPEILQRHLGI